MSEKECSKKVGAARLKSGSRKEGFTGLESGLSSFHPEPGLSYCEVPREPFGLVDHFSGPQIEPVCLLSVPIELRLFEGRRLGEEPPSF
jgi:hypothetical protein